MENPNHQLSDLEKLVKRINFATQEKLEAKFDLLIEKIDGENKKDKLLGNVKYIDIDNFKKQISTMISSQMEESLELFAQKFEDKTGNLENLNIKIEAMKIEVMGKNELKCNDDISKTLHKLEEDVIGKDYVLQENDFGECKIQRSARELSWQITK